MRYEIFVNADPAFSRVLNRRSALESKGIFRGAKFHVLCNSSELIGGRLYYVGNLSLFRAVI